MTNQDKPTELMRLIIEALKFVDETYKHKFLTNPERFSAEDAQFVGKAKDLLKKIDTDQLDVTFYSRIF